MTRLCSLVGRKKNLLLCLQRVEFCRGVEFLYCLGQSIADPISLLFLPLNFFGNESESFMLFASLSTSFCFFKLSKGI